MSSEPMKNDGIDELIEKALEQRIVHELERVPDLSSSIPADFAVRVAAKVPLRRAVPVAPSRYGRAAMWISLAALFGVLLVVAGLGLGRSALGVAIEWCLCAQFLTIAVWMTIYRRREG
jgi:hypothetical protein